jgi:glucoamylase
MANGHAVTEAFGGPGIEPTFAAGDKDLVVTALGSARVWLTVGGGVVNEVFWPTTSRPQLRDLGFLVTGTDFWVELKRAAHYTITTPDPAVPWPTIVHQHERFQLTLEIVCDPTRDAIVLRYDLEGRGDTADAALALHLLAAPHIGGRGRHNDAWVEDGVLHAGRGDEHLAIVADSPFAHMSAGYVGASDGWQDISTHGRPTWEFTSAPDGNVALTATLSAAQGEIAVAFATSATGARTLAMGAIVAEFDVMAAGFAQSWLDWAADLPTFATTDRLSRLARTSAMVLKVHEDLTFPGAIVASLATPWGFAHDDPGGYHLVWPRDCAETGLALAAIGLTDDAHRTLEFLASTQQPDGHWPQNFTPGGEAYWSGLQLDETALPIILAAKLVELGRVDPTAPVMATMVRKAARYLVANGPLTQQDRWEETGGASPFTLAALVAALTAAGSYPWLDPMDARCALSMADWWNSRIEALVYTSGTDLDIAHGTAGHYGRVAHGGDTGMHGELVLANRGGESFDLQRLVGLEFLALVRYGLRSADDPRITDTVKIIDAVLRADTAAGPLYYRYQHDGYGEHADGAPFDGTGIGRPWPLLTGERGHYAVDAGADPQPYLDAMAASVSLGNLLPEQVWDGPPIPERRLFPGRPTGSATPLVWAHAELLKLLVASTTGVVSDRLTCVAGRYKDRRKLEIAHIRHRTRVVTSAPLVIIEREAPFRLHFGIDGWNELRDADATPIGLGRYGVRISRQEFPTATSIAWTTYDPTARTWEGVDHLVEWH